MTAKIIRHPPINNQIIERNETLRGAEGLRADEMLSKRHLKELSLRGCIEPEAIPL